MLPNLQKATPESRSLILKLVKHPATKADVGKNITYKVLNNKNDGSEQVRSMILNAKENWKSFLVEKTVSNNKFQRVYSTASGLLGKKDVESKQNPMNRRKSTRPALFDLSPPPTEAKKGRKINADSRKTRSKSGHLEPLYEPPPKSARMTARLKTMKPQDTEVTEASDRKDSKILSKGVKSRLKCSLKSISNVPHSEKENQVEKETNDVTLKQELMYNRRKTDEFLTVPAEHELLNQYSVARKARKTFPKKLPVPIIPTAIIKSEDINQITVNNMVCIYSKLNPPKSSDFPPLVTMCQPSTSSSSSSSSKPKLLSIHPTRMQTPNIISLENNKPTISESVFPVSSTNADSFQKSSFLPNLSTGLASATAETITTLPKLFRVPSHPLHSDGTGFQRDCGQFTRTLIENSHRLTDHFRKLIEDILYNISQTHPEATVHQLRVEIEELNDKHKKEITDLKRNTGESFSNNFKSLNQ